MRFKKANIGKMLSTLAAILVSVSLLAGCSVSTGQLKSDLKNIQEWTEKSQAIINELYDGRTEEVTTGKTVDLNDIPEFSDEPFVIVNNNVPDFSEEEKENLMLESYSNLDSYGRCGPAIANVSKDIMPTEKRGPIGMVKPAGWHTVKYENVDGKYLYNRCHLIGFQLAGENANEKNLITGTRYMNVTGMLPFENLVAEYVKETGNHVIYRVTPIYNGDELVARGVQMEAESIENENDICFNVFVYNSQPGIIIDYATGDSRYAS